MQVIVLATVALAVASLCTVAVPKLAGDLIDVCIHFGQGSYDAGQAKHKLNGQSCAPHELIAYICISLTSSPLLCNVGMLYKILIVLAVGGIASGLRSW